MEKLQLLSESTTKLARIAPTWGICGLSGGALTEQCLCDIFEGFSNEMREQLQQASNGNGNAEANVGECIETGQGYRWHSYRGSFHRVPEDWSFPLLKNSSSLSSQSPALRGSSTLLALLVSFLKIACLHVSFTAHENFYKLYKMYCHLVLTFHFPIFRMSECRNPAIKHISTYTLVSLSINTYVTDLFLGSFSHNKIRF